MNLQIIEFSVLINIFSIAQSLLVYCIYKEHNVVFFKLINKIFMHTITFF